VFQRAYVRTAQPCCLRASSPLAQLELARHVRRLSQEAGDAVGAARAANGTAEAFNGLCRWGDASDAFRESAKLAREAGDRRLFESAAGDAIWFAVEGPTPLVECVAEAERMLGDVVGPYARSHILAALAKAAALDGRLDESRALLERADAVWYELGLQDKHHYTQLQRGAIELAARSAARARTSSVDDDLLAQIDWRRAQAHVDAAVGNVQAARAVATEAVGLAAQMDSPLFRGDASLALYMACRAGGDTVAADRALAAAIGEYESKPAPALVQRALRLAARTRA
jgi:hypothetical protein